MTQSSRYREVLLALDDWQDYLTAESGLPGPRANLELVETVADIGDRRRFDQLLACGPDVAPANTPGEFLAVCGVVGLGKLLVEGDMGVLERLRQHANDPRWRVREGVAMALQRSGREDAARLIDWISPWQNGSLLERRALAAALCEPDLLTDKTCTRRTLEILDKITTSILSEVDRRSDEFKTLRKGLGYCWSVAVAALPDAGIPAMERWFDCDDRDILWVMRENLRKARLMRADPAWVERSRARLGM
ncbi:MAG: hypothetical protein GX620_17575 [Chloroflexi bacterium]|nr:hypothetical protein [Chloroflexota bacterium]